MRNSIHNAVLVLSVIGLVIVGCQTTEKKGATTFGPEKRVIAPEFKLVAYVPEKAQEGTTILADLHNVDRPKIIEVNMRGELVWEYLVTEPEYSSRNHWPKASAVQGLLGPEEC